MNWQERKVLLRQLTGVALEKAIPVLRREINPASPLFDELTLQQSQLQDLQSEIRDGTISRPDRNLIYNRIRVSLREIVDLMGESDFHPDLAISEVPGWEGLLKSIEDTRPRKRILRIVAGVVIAILLAGAFRWQQTFRSLDPPGQVSGPDSIDFHGMLLDRNDRLLGNALILVGEVEVRVATSGRFQQKIPFPEDTIVPIRIFIDDSLVKYHDQTLNSQIPYVQKIEAFP